MTGLVEISGLRVRYGGAEAVKQLDLSIGAQETVALVGESGCGKSTTALAMMGLLPPGAEVAGRALFDGQDLLALGARDLRRLRGRAISMIFQDSMASLNPVLSVGRQIVETLELHTTLPGKAAWARATELLDLVGIRQASERARQFPHEFSGGQRQRIAIAMAVACGPKLLIADEPTTALDAAVQGRILKLLHRLKGELGMSLLLITHDLGLVAEWADRMVIMRRGVLVEEGPARQIFDEPREPYTRVLMGAAFTANDRRHYATDRLPDTREVDLLARGVAPFPTPRAPARPLGFAEPLLSAKGLEARYVRATGRANALDGVDLEIAPGETLGLVGESGCGKSTLSRVLMKLQPSSGGVIRFEGQDVTHLKEAAFKAFRPRIQMIFQDPQASLNPRRRVVDIMQQTLRTNGVKSPTERSRRILEIAERVGLAAGALERFPHELSGGQKQRVAIARALLLRPALLICDEPASSLDLPIRAQVLNLLSDLKAEFGLSYLFISHDLAVIRYMADRVAVMHEGRIVETGDARQIWDAPQHPYTQGLIAAAPGLAARADLPGPRTPVVTSDAAHSAFRTASSPGW